MTLPSFLLKVLNNAAYKHVCPCMSTFFRPLSSLKPISINFFAESYRDSWSKANYKDYETTEYS